MQLITFMFIINIYAVWNVRCNDLTRTKRETTVKSPYDDSYDKFISRHFSDSNKKHLDKYVEYKDTHDGTDSGEEYDDDEGAHHDDGVKNEKKSKSDVADDDSYGVDHDWYYKDNGRDDYERIKALSERQVSELQKNPGNCKHYEKEGMTCATCEDPETGDTSESCTYLSKPKDKKLAYMSKKSHNLKKKPKVELSEDDSREEESDSLHEGLADDDEALLKTSTKRGPKPLKHISESEDAEYGAFKLAGGNDDVDDYDSTPKFAQLKIEPAAKKKMNNAKGKQQQTKHDFEIIPQANFKSKNLNQALADFKTKDWSKCDKIMKGDMTCYNCKDHKGAKQEECMFVQESNPAAFKVEHREASNFDENSRRKRPKISATSTTVTQTPKTFEAVKREKFARLRMGRPLMPTKAPKSTAEPLVTPNTLNPTDFDHFNTDSKKKAFKRTINIKIRRNLPSIFSDKDSDEETTKATSFSSFVEHDE